MNMYYLYDKNGKCNCKVYHTRRTEHVKNLFHPVYYIIVYNEKHDILLKRKYVKKKPTKWDFAIMGQPSTNEKLQDCLMVLPFEEIGTFIDLSKFEYAEDIIDEDRGEWCTIVFAYDNHPIDYYFSDQVDIDEYGFASIDELTELLYSSDFAPHSDKFKEDIIKIIKNKFNELNTRQKFIPLG